MERTPARVLVVDDEEYLADLVATVLKYHGFETATARTAAEARVRVGAFRPDLIVLDVMLPDGSGIETCERLRREGCDAHVIFLTARDATEDKITGLTAGGDDYVTKPFSLEELVARVHAVLRRARADDRRSALLTFADLEINEDIHQVRRGGAVVDLTPTEFKFLRYLMLNPGRVLTKQQILDHVWEYGFGGRDSVVQTYVSYLRRKVDNVDPRLIHTVPYLGYILRMPVDGGTRG